MISGKSVASPLRVAFLVGRDSVSTRLSIESVCSLSGILPAAILLDVEQPSRSKRWKSLRRNVRREGLFYVPHRVVEGVHAFMDRLSRCVVDQDTVNRLLRDAFPNRDSSLDEIGKRYGAPVFRVKNLNGPRAAEILKKENVDLGIVLGTRILKRSTFAVPRLGSINLHKGSVPDYRGLPPGFWELYDGKDSAGITVHFVDDGLDTGDVIGMQRVDIADTDNELSLRTKLDRDGARLLARCVENLRDGTAVRVPQPADTRKPRTNPTRRDRQAMRKRAPARLVDAYPKGHIVKTAAYLALYYSGFYWGIRWLRRMTGSSRAVVLLYHRVNDLSSDGLTASTTAFAEHIALLKRHYRVLGTSDLLGYLERGEAIPACSVVIHFDDCYRDVWVNAAPILRAAGCPATAFIASGFVGTDRSFEHDRNRSPFEYENLSEEEVRSLVSSGMEVGAHTVNHVNLGKISREEVVHEVMGSRHDLERILGAPVVLFSFPFGRLSDISDAARDVVQGAGFRALFSAHGGVIKKHCNRFDLPRRGASTEHRPLDMMMEIEGLSPGDWVPGWIRSRR